MILDTNLRLSAAEEAGRRGDWAEAAQLYEQLASEQPEDTGLLLRQANALAEAGQSGAAESIFNRALRLQPGAPALLLTLARFLRRAGRPAEALALYRSAIARTPDDATAEDEARALEREAPAAFTKDISGRLVLARRALAQGDAVTAAEHYDAVLSAIPELDEVRTRLAGLRDARPEGLEATLEAEAQRWRVALTGEGAPVPPPALQEEGAILYPPCLDAYLAGHYAAAVEALPPDAPSHGLSQDVLTREQRLREMASSPREEAAALFATAPAATLADAAKAAPHDYFSPEAAWLRHLLRRALASGEALPASSTLPLALLRFEPDIILALAEREGPSLLLCLPVITRDGGLFYGAVDACIRRSDVALGLPLARIGEMFFLRRNSPFKSQEFIFKAATLLLQQGDQAAAVTCFTRLLAETDDRRLLLAALTGTLQNVDGKAVADLVSPILVTRPEELLTEALKLLFERSGGRGDALQRQSIVLLSRALSGAGRPSVTLPAAVLSSPVLLGHALRSGGQGLEGHAGLQAALRQAAAFASGFADLDASEQHLKDLLAAKDEDGIAAIGAYITRRHGHAFQRHPDRVTTILGSGNVGDTFLYMAGFAAFARASGQPVHVLHRAGRTSLTEFFGETPGLTFEPIPNDLRIPVPLSLNRLAVGNVSLFYEVPWYRRHEERRLERSSITSNFLWDKIVSVLLSGAAMLPERITPQRPPVTPPAAASEAARRRFAELGLRKGRTVFLSPLANTLFSLTPSRLSHFQSFWLEAIRLFQAAGFTVAANATNNNHAQNLFHESSVPELDLDLRELPAFVAECGYFAGVRSGLCDLLALCGLEGVQSRTLYMRGGEHCIGLADFGMSEAVADFQQHSPRALAESFFADWLAHSR